MKQSDAPNLRQPSANGRDAGDGESETNSDMELKMTFSFSINAKPQPNRLTKRYAATDSPGIKFVTEFRSDEAPPSESQVKPIAPIPNKRLKNLPNLPQLFKSNGEVAGIQFELVSSSNPEPSENSTGHGLTLRKPSVSGSDVPDGKSLREDLANLPDGPGLDHFEDVPVEGFGAALLYGYGWKEGRGIGRNAKEDVTVHEATKKRGRGGLGFTEEMPEPENRSSTMPSCEDLANANGSEEKMKVWKEKDV